MIPEIILIGGAGFLGGLIRGLVGWSGIGTVGSDCNVLCSGI